MSSRLWKEIWLSFAVKSSESPLVAKIKASSKKDLTKLGKKCMFVSCLVCHMIWYGSPWLCILYLLCQGSKCYMVYGAKACYFFFHSIVKSVQKKCCNNWTYKKCTCVFVCLGRRGMLYLLLKVCCCRLLEWVSSCLCKPEPLLCSENCLKNCLFVTLL